MIADPPEWTWWAMVGLLALVMLLPIIKRYRSARRRLAAVARGGSYRFSGR